MANLKLGIVGAGLIGSKRADNLPSHVVISDVVDLDINRAVNLAPHANHFCSWQEMLESSLCDAVFVCTLHNSLAEIALAAIKQGKHVLVEKPAGINTGELERLYSAAEAMNVHVHVGFNHRYHRSIRKAFELLDENAIGDVMFIRGMYGHGGRLGYDKEWRSDVSLSGGGELIDQGPHLIDLSRKILKSDFASIYGRSHTYFWDMSVDDNSFMHLTTPSNQSAFLHVSCTEWKNMFSLEVYGKEGKLHLNGLGGSYGLERLHFYKMLPEMGPPETLSWEFPMADDSWNTKITNSLILFLLANILVKLCSMQLLL